MNFIDKLKEEAKEETGEEVNDTSGAEDFIKQLLTNKIIGNHESFIEFVAKDLVKLPLVFHRELHDKFSEEQITSMVIKAYDYLLVDEVE